MRFQQAITVTSLSHFSKTNRCHKSGFWNGSIDNSINCSINMSETHFVHINSSRRIFWCACQPLVVAQPLKLLKLETLSSIFVCYSNFSQKHREKSNMQQSMTMTSKHDMFRYGWIHFDRHHSYSIHCFLNYFHYIKNYSYIINCSPNT